MDLIKPISHAIYELHHFAGFSDDHENKDLGCSLINVSFITSHRLTMMTQLFNRVGPLVKSPLLTHWKHASVLEWRPVAFIFRGRLAWILPYQSIFLFGIFLIAVFQAFKGNPEVTLAGRKIHVIAILIKGVEITTDVASTVSAVALIILGQPITGGCVLVFMVIQVAARSGVFHEPSKTEAISTKKKKSKTSLQPTINPDTPPWLVRDSKKIQSIWLKIPKGYRELALKKDYFWVVMHVGHIAGIIAAPEAAVLRICKGFGKIYVGPLLEPFLKSLEEPKKKKSGEKSGFVNHDTLD